MQSWGWANVPPVAVGKFSHYTKVHQVSPASTSTDASEEGRLTPKDRRAAAHEQEVHQVSPASTSTTRTSTDASEGGKRTTSTNASEGGRLTAKTQRAALEQEVARLRKRHSQEVNLHKAMDRALQRPVGVLPRIPSYLPVKIQKLLAEVAVLEEEVIRLEDHVLCLRHELSDESTKFAYHGAITHKQKQQQQHVINDSKSSSKARVTKSAIKDPLSKFSKPSQQKPKEHSLAKAPKFSYEEPTACVSAVVGGRNFHLPNPVAGPRKATAASAAANEAVSKGQGQQPWKPMRGTNGKSNLFCQSNVLSWADAKPPAMPAKKLGAVYNSTQRTSSRKAAGFLPNPPINYRSEKLQCLSSGPKSFPSSAPRPAPASRIRHQQQPFTGMPSRVQLWEKENLQSSSAGAAKLTALKCNIRGPKVGLSGGNLFSSNVERRPRTGHKV